MNQITDASLLAAIGRHMNQAVARQSVAASNLANVDTPGYKAREVSFADELEGQLAPIAKTSPKHLSGGFVDASGTRETTSAKARRDGNTVELDQEILNMSRAAGSFTAAQTALSAKFRLVRYALNEGR